ncbi:ketopantoate reductase family protein [Lacinutrix undariae]
MKIGILGMGGIGSFIGEKLTKNYENDSETNVVFICRNETKKAINTNGLSLTSEGETTTITPYLATDDTKKIGELDILIVATKSFSLDNTISKYQECLKENTVIIPLQNGVNAKNSIQENITHNSNKILEGCIYIASNIDKPGVVKHVGGPGKIVFGNSDTADYKWVEDVLVKGGLSASYTKDIKTFLWKKYLFVSPLATITTALNITFGEVVESVVHMDLLKKMMQEIQDLAAKNNITLSDNDIETALGMLSNFPQKSKTSLQLDFENKNKNTEKENLVDYVIKASEAFGITAKNYTEMSAKIVSRYNL